MKEIQFNNKKYSVPTSWDEVTLHRQMQVERYASNQTNEAAKKIAMIAGYSGIPINELKNAHINKITPLMKHIQFINEPFPKEPLYEFEHRGVKYSVLDTLTKGEFQDWISYETVMQDYKDNTYNALPIVIAILAKREGESLDDYDPIERSKEFYDLPISIAHRLWVFFYLTEKGFTLPTQLSSIQKLVLERSFLESENILSRRGGTVLHTLWLRLLKSYVKSLKKSWSSYLTTFQSRDSNQSWMKTFIGSLKRKLKMKRKVDVQKDN